MSFNPRQFLRMTKWARQPPSDRRVKLIIGILALCLLLLAVERLVGWPDWLTLPDTPRGRIR